MKLHSLILTLILTLTTFTPLLLRAADVEEISLGSPVTNDVSDIWVNLYQKILSQPSFDKLKGLMTWKQKATVNPIPTMEGQAYIEWYGHNSNGIQKTSAQAYFPSTQPFSVIFKTKQTILPSESVVLEACYKIC